MSIGLYGGPDTYISPARYYYNILSGLYLQDEHFKKVQKIRRAETDEDSLKIYYEHRINTDILLHGRYNDDEEIISATERLKKVLEGRKIKYPTPEQAQEQLKKDNRRRMEEAQSKCLIKEIDKMDEKTKKFIFGDM